MWALPIWQERWQLLPVYGLSSSPPGSCTPEATNVQASARQAECTCLCTHMGVCVHICTHIHSFLWWIVIKYLYCTDAWLLLNEICSPNMASLQSTGGILKRFSDLKQVRSPGPSYFEWPVTLLSRETRPTGRVCVHVSAAL